MDRAQHRSGKPEGKLLYSFGNPDQRMITLGFHSRCYVLLHARSRERGSGRSSHKIWGLCRGGVGRSDNRSRSPTRTVNQQAVGALEAFQGFVELIMANHADYQGRNPILGRTSPNAADLWGFSPGRVKIDDPQNEPEHWIPDWSPVPEGPLRAQITWPAEDLAEDHTRPTRASRIILRHLNGCLTTHLVSCKTYLPERDIEWATSWVSSTGWGRQIILCARNPLSRGSRPACCKKPKARRIRRKRRPGSSKLLTSGAEVKTRSRTADRKVTSTPQGKPLGEAARSPLRSKRKGSVLTTGPPL